MTLTRKLRMIFMLLCMTVASSFCVQSATQAVFAAEIQHNELIDGGITGSIYEQQFDETVAFIYELREEGYHTIYKFGIACYKKKCKVMSVKVQN